MAINKKITSKEEEKLNSSFISSLWVNLNYMKILLVKRVVWNKESNLQIQFWTNVMHFLLFVNSSIKKLNKLHKLKIKDCLIQIWSLNFNLEWFVMSYSIISFTIMIKIKIYLKSSLNLVKKSKKLVSELFSYLLILHSYLQEKLFYFYIFICAIFLGKRKRVYNIKLNLKILNIWKKV